MGFASKTSLNYQHTEKKTATKTRNSKFFKRIKYTCFMFYQLAKSKENVPSFIFLLLLFILFRIILMTFSIEG